jgi:hypothetical protein
MKIKPLKVAFISLIFSAACIVNVAKATLIDGKEWMQLTQTSGYTWQQFDQIFGASGFCTSGCLLGGTLDLSGFRWASSAEVDNMINTVTGTALFGNYVSNQGVVTLASQTDGMFSLLNATITSSFTREIEGYTRNQVTSGQGSGIDIFDWSSGGDSGAKNLKTNFDVTVTNGQYGAWLYQDSQPNSVPEPSTLAIFVLSVPEPSTFAIFALGVIGLAYRRFKKQS